MAFSHYSQSNREVILRESALPIIFNNIQKSQMTTLKTLIAKKGRRTGGDSAVRARIAALTRSDDIQTEKSASSKDNRARICITYRPIWTKTNHRRGEGGKDSSEPTNEMAEWPFDI